MGGFMVTLKPNKMPLEKSGEWYTMIYQFAVRKDYSNKLRGINQM